MSREQENELTPIDRELEAAMKALRPAASGLDPIAVAFAAGAVRRSQSIWMWRAVAAVFAVALGVSVIASNRQMTTPGRTLAIQPAPATAPAPTYVTMESRNAPSYRRLRERVLDQGLDALVVPIHSPGAEGESFLRTGQTNWKPS